MDNTLLEVLQTFRRRQVEAGAPVPAELTPQPPDENLVASMTAALGGDPAQLRQFLTWYDGYRDGIGLRAYGLGVFTPYLSVIPDLNKVLVFSAVGATFLGCKTTTPDQTVSIHLVTGDEKEPMVASSIVTLLQLWIETLEAGLRWVGNEWDTSTFVHAGGLDRISDHAVAAFSGSYP